MNIQSKITSRTLTRAEWSKAYSRARKIVASGQYPSYQTFGDIGRLVHDRKHPLGDPAPFRAAAIWRRGHAYLYMSAARVFLDPAKRAAVIARLQGDLAAHAIAKRDADLAMIDASHSSSSETRWNRNGGRSAYAQELMLANRIYAAIAVRDFRPFMGDNLACVSLYLPEAKR